MMDALELRNVLDFMTLQQKIAEEKVRNETVTPDSSAPIKIDYKHMVGPSVVQSMGRGYFVPVKVECVTRRYATTKMLECY